MLPRILIDPRLALAAVFLCAAAASCHRSQPESSAIVRQQLTLSHVVTLGTESDPFSPTQGFEFEVTESFYVVTDHVSPSSFFIYDSSGNFLEEIKRRGDGPGEFRGPLLPVAIGHDSVLITDQSTGRYLVFDLPNPQPIMQGNLGGPVMDLKVRVGGIIFTGPRNHAGSLRLLHSFDLNGSDVSTPLPAQAKPGGGRHGILVGSSSAFSMWTPADEFELNIYTADGQERRLSYRSPWFLGGFAPEGVDLAGAHQLPATVLGLLIPWPDLALVSMAIPARSDVPAETYGEIDDPFSEFYRTHIEAVDINNDRLHAQITFHGLAKLSRSKPWLGHLSNKNSIPVLEVYKLNLGVN